MSFDYFEHNPLHSMLWYTLVYLKIIDPYPPKKLSGNLSISSRRMYWGHIEDLCWVCLLSHFSCVQLFVILQTVAVQAPLSMGFSRQEYWSGLPCPPPGDLPNPGIEPASLTALVLADRFFTTSATWKGQYFHKRGKWEISKQLYSLGRVGEV